jgi:hypothetical protein
LRDTPARKRARRESAKDDEGRAERQAPGGPAVAAAVAVAPGHPEGGSLLALPGPVLEMIMARVAASLGRTGVCRDDYFVARDIARAALVGARVGQGSLHS